MIGSISNQVRFLFSVILLSVFSPPVFAQKHADVNGTWKMNVETSVGSGTPVFELKHASDTTFTGTYKGQLGEAPVTGKVKAKAIHLQFTVSGNLVEYDGTVNRDTMKGSVKLGSMATGTFSGSRSK
ncbi:MAG: hypothetical protein K2U26_16135 [Cyclobacteriaceae bacterium]|nr:hypothetical protein [Cyclobacteriaceae bacterium]